MGLLEYLRMAHEKRNALTVQQVAKRLARTTAFVERMTEVGELHPLPGNTMMFTESEVKRAKEILDRRRKAIEEIHRIDTEERKELR